MDIAIRSEGVTQAEAKLRQMADNVSDLTPAWAEVRALIKKRENEWLSSKGDGTFAPLAESTLRQGRRRSDRPLDKTGDLWDSLTQETATSYYDATPTRLEIGTRSPVAHWHMADRAHMPARRPLPPIDENMKRQIKDILKAHVRSGQRRLW